MKSTILLSLLLSTSVLAQQPDSSSALFQMKDAELNFARHSVTYGRKAAFSEFLADESVIFTDNWIMHGKQYWLDRKASALVLKWEPEFMDIATSGDFGVSTGPWEAQEFRPYTLPVSTGYYLSVWKKQPGGKWKVILDAGTTTPPEKKYKHGFSFPEGADNIKVSSSSVPIDNSITFSELASSEQQLNNAWQAKPESATYLRFISPSARLLVSGHLPATDPVSIKLRISELDKSIAWIPDGYGASDSGDMGYVFGITKTGTINKKISGNYVRIWKRRPDNSWAIIIEVMSAE